MTIAGCKIPRSFGFRTEHPRSGTGKVLMNMQREKALALAVD